MHPRPPAGPHRGHVHDAREAPRRPDPRPGVQEPPPPPAPGGSAATAQCAPSRVGGAHSGFYPLCNGLKVLQHKNFIGRRCHSNCGLKFAPRLIKELKNVMILSLSVCHDIITPFLLRYCFTYIVKCTFYNAIFNKIHK